MAIPEQGGLRRLQQPTPLTRLFLVVLSTVFLLTAGCTSSSGSSDDAAESSTETNGEAANTSSSTSDTATGSDASSNADEAAPPPGDLTVDRFNDGVYCDGTERPAVVVLGASPGETITFTSPMPVTIADGTADGRGSYQLPWSCEANEASLFWDVTATGVTSNRRITFQISGSYDDPEAARVMTFTPAPDPLTCDGRSRVVGELDNAEPNETVQFTTTDSATGQLRSGAADGKGTVSVNWSCDPEEADKTWTVQASAPESGRSASFTITGNAPERAEGPIEVELPQTSVICDRARRVVAVLTNLTPLATVNFEASPSNGALQSGQADSGGELTAYWQCHRTEADTTWTMTATEVGPGGTDPREASFTFTGTANPNPTSIAIVEDPFRCDGTSHDFAVLSGFVSGEFIDFTSPQSESIRQGQADANGDLPIRWQCDPSEADSVWEVTASGQTSGLTLSFTVTGGPA